MSKILITGGTGNLGKSLTKLLDTKAIEYTIGSRSNRNGATNIAVMDLISNQGIEEAVKGKNIIFHLATDMKKDTQITQNLINAIGQNPDVHLIYISIVGIDKTPFNYYQQKLASENLIKSSGINYTILRATQFHEFAHQIISTFLKHPIGILPKKLVLQPIEIDVVAKELYRLSLEKSENKTYEIGGRGSFTLEEMAQQWMEETGKKRLIINLPIFGKLGKAFRNGHLTTFQRSYESMSWKSWLKIHSEKSVQKPQKETAPILA